MAHSSQSRWLDILRSLFISLVGIVLLVIAAGMTSFYSWRLVFLTFFGKPRASSDVMHHVHESPMVMLLPLALLAHPTPPERPEPLTPPAPYPARFAWHPADWPSRLCRYCV